MARKLQSDKWLFLATLALVCASVVMVYSASALVALERFQQPYLFVTKQVMMAVLGIALMSALQTVGVWSLQEHIKSQSNAGLPIGNTPVVGNFDADALKNGILPKFGPIDTSEGQRLAIEGAARRIDLQSRTVQKYIPR